MYNTKHRYYKNRKVISLKYGEAVCVIQGGCTANVVKKKLNDLEKQIFTWKNKVSE